MTPVHSSRREPGATSALEQQTACLGSALRAWKLRRRPQGLGGMLWILPREGP